MSKYTPGPWVDSGLCFIKKDDYIIAETDTYPSQLLNPSKEECRANARLIAAAPELLEALKELLPMQGCVQCQELYSHCDRHGYIVDTIKKCEQAILKAEGG